MSSDLRKANQHMLTRRAKAERDRRAHDKAFADYRRRTGERRDRRRQLDLLVKGIGRGWLL